MANCKKCPFYASEYDELRQSGNDTIIEDQEHKEHHFCIMHDDHIDDYFIHGKKCEYEV
jgi:hypothetical protein